MQYKLNYFLKSFIEKISWIMGDALIHCNCFVYCHVEYMIIKVKRKSGQSGSVGWAPSCAPKFASSIPGQGTCLGVSSIPLKGRYGRQLIHASLSPPFSLLSLSMWKKRKTNGHDRAGEKCQRQSLLVISVCGKIVPKTLFSFVYGPGRLIRVKVTLKCNCQHRKQRTVGS